MRRAVRLSAAALLAAAGVLIVAAGVFVWHHQRAVDRERAALRASIVPVYRGRYDAGSYYVGPLTTVLDPPSVILGRNRLPVVRYEGQGYRTNPVTIAQFGLWQYGVFLRTGAKPARAAFLRASDWFVDHQRGGRWWYDFAFSHDGWTMSPPWASAMAQGSAMSLLERAYRLTGRSLYLSAATRALAPIQRPVALGGLERCFFGDCRLPFYEEYPSNPPSYVLNGFMFTLVGLYDLASVAPRSGARPAFRRGLRTLQAALPRYDVSDLAAYALSQETVAGQRPDLNRGYQAVDVYLLNALDSVSPNAVLRRYAARWTASI